MNEYLTRECLRSYLIQTVPPGVLICHLNYNTPKGVAVFVADYTNTYDVVQTQGGAICASSARWGLGTKQLLAAKFASFLNNCTC